MPRTPLLIIAGFFLTGGIAHFLVADFFVAIIPTYLPWHWELVIVSGVFELAGAIGLLLPPNPFAGGVWINCLMCGGFPRQFEYGFASGKLC